MATTSLSISHQSFFIYSSSSSESNYNSSKSYTSTPINRSNLSLRTFLKSTSSKHDSTSLQTSPEDLKPISKPKQPDPPPPEPLSFLRSPFFVNLRRLRDESFKYDGIVVDILSIALPAALAADPITSLVDTAFVGHLGSVELAAVGVSASVFNLVLKLLNVPLLNITTSFVAEEQAVVLGKAEDGANQQIGDDSRVENQGKKFLPSASTSLALAASIGIVEAVSLFLGSGVLMDAMGISADSPMRIPAEQFQI